MSDDSSRVARWEQRTEWPLTVTALLFLIAYAVPILDTRMSAGSQTACHVVVLIAWVVFGIDYLARLTLAQRRWSYWWRHLHDLAVLALPVLRPLRLLRVLMLLRALNRTGAASLRGRIAIYVSAGTVLLLFCASLTVLDAERGHAGANITAFPDALWWSATTITTVGYGDRFPVTAEGRSVAVGLMLGGIALLGVVTASIASWLVQRVSETEESAQAATRADIRALLAEVSELRRAMQGMQAAAVSGATSGDASTTPLRPSGPPPQ
jgi:voltage-gated potassium channel